MLITHNEDGSFPDLNAQVEQYIIPPKLMTNLTHITLIKEDFHIGQGEYYLIRMPRKNLGYANALADDVTGYIEVRNFKVKGDKFLLKHNPLLASAFPTKFDAETAAAIVGISGYELVQVKEIMEPYILSFIMGYDLIIDFIWDDGTCDNSSEAIYTKYPTLGEHIEELGYIDMFRVADEKAYNDYLEYTKQLKTDLINKVHNRLLEVHSMNIDLKNCTIIKENS